MSISFVGTSSSAMGRCLVLVAVCCFVVVVQAAQLPPFGRHPPGCPKCVPDDCPKTVGECSGFLVPDVCACCPQGVCGLKEGEKCFNVSASHVLSAEYRKYGVCGPDLFCELRQDLTERDEPEALCVCKENQAVCGTDGRTYETVCQLKEEAYGRSGINLQVKEWGPCDAAPWVISSPSDSAATMHQSLTLDCEVKGSPIPSVHWEFKGADGTHRTLPSDDLSVAVQVRGGPEPYMVTSWLQIVDLRLSDMGVYSCVATNEMGVSTATAKVTVQG